MFDDAVVPLLKRELPVAASFSCLTLRTTGIGESLVEERISPPLTELIAAGLEVGYCARPGQVDVRLTARGAESAAILTKAEQIARERLAPYVFGTGDDDLAATIIQLLANRKQTLALAESCTGGHIANELTNVPGSSAVLLAALVTYSNEAKRQLLGVKGATLEEHGAVSEPVAREMAEGARRQLKSDFAISVTGIAGPAGGTAAKPVGTVFIALAGPFGTIAQHHLNPYDRLTFKQVTAQQALDLLRRKLLE